MTGSVWPSRFVARHIQGHAGVTIQCTEKPGSDVTLFFSLHGEATGTPLERLYALRAACDEAEAILMAQGKGAAVREAKP